MILRERVAKIHILHPHKLSLYNISTIKVIQYDPQLNIIGFVLKLLDEIERPILGTTTIPLLLIGKPSHTEPTFFIFFYNLKIQKHIRKIPNNIGFIKLQYQLPAFKRIFKK